jgi:preprotein translocase subunit SecD
MKYVALLGLLLACAVCGAPRVAVEFRLAETEPGEGLTELTLHESGDVFYLHADAAIHDDDIASASVTKHGGRSAVEVVLTAEGSKKLAAVTERNVKRRMGMVVDGRLVSAPIINAPITGGRAILQGDFSDEEALRIAQGLRAQAAGR